jgi:hypothetical protein
VPYRGKIVVSGSGDLLPESINALYKAQVIHKEGTLRGVDDDERATMPGVDWSITVEFYTPLRRATR